MEFVSVYVTGMLHVVLQQMIVLTVTNKEHTAKQLVMSMLFVFAMHSVIGKLISLQGILLILVLTAILFLSYLLFFKLPPKESIILAFLQMLLSTFAEYTVHLFWAVTGFQLDMYEHRNQLFVRLFVAAGLLLLYSLIRSVRLKLPQVDQQQRYTLWIAYLAFLFLFSMPNMAAMENRQQYSYSSIELYNLVLFLVFFSYNVIYVRNLFRLIDVSQQLEMQKLYTETLENTTNQLRNFKHSYDNTLTTISGLVNRGDLEGLARYRSELVVELATVNTVDHVNSQLRHIPILYGIVLSKLSLAELHGVDFRISIPCRIELNYCSSVDFSRMVGILLDNALEAAIESEEKSMQMSVVCRFDVYTLRVENYCPTSVDTDQIFNYGYSSKQGHMGVGLSEVMKTVGKYRARGYDMGLATKYHNKQFTVILTV